MGRVHAQKHQKSSVVDLDAIMLTSYIMFCLIMPLAQQHKKKMGVDVISHTLLQMYPRISARQGALYGIQTPDRDSCFWVVFNV